MRAVHAQPCCMLSVNYQPGLCEHVCTCSCCMLCRFLDTDVPEEAKSIYKQLKKQWQTIKAHSLEVGAVPYSIGTQRGTNHPSQELMPAST